MNWSEMISEGGIWAVICYILIKEVMPLLRNKGSSSECAQSHSVILERLTAASEARKVEADLQRETIAKLAEIFERIYEQLHEMMAILKNK
jgi:hypothetical protein